MKNIDISLILSDGKAYEGKAVNVAGWVRATAKIWRF